MINILLVDDEPLIREVLRTLFNWEDYGFRIVGESYNGIEALKAIDRCEVDIVLTDIKMPVMDGLELIRAARQVNKGIAFVVLSAYDEFYLVSDAFKAGAKDYILKSEMTKEKIIHVLEKVTLEMMEARQQYKFIEEQKQIRKLFKQNHQVIRYNMLRELIEGRISHKEDIINDLVELGLRFEGEKIVVMAMKIEFFDDRISEDLLRQISEQLEKILDSHGIGNLLPHLPGEYILIFYFDAREDEGSINEKISILYNDISKIMENEYDAIVSAGLSRVEKGMAQVGRLYQQALVACQNAFVQGKGILIFYSHLPIEISRGSLNGDKKLNTLKELLKSLDPKKIRAGIDSVVIYEEFVDQTRIDGIRGIFERYYVYIQEYSMYYFLDQDLAHILEKYDNNLRHNGDLKQLNHWIRELIITIAETLQGGNHIVNRAKNYIHKNFQDNISLSKVAKEVGVNSSYLSRIFTKEVGCNFMDYLARIRLEAALEYMTNSNMKIYEIAEKVGYNNAEHFSRMFKKVYGKSPREYLA